MNKNLQEAIREIVKQQGKNVMKDVRLVNILSDTFSFEDLPAAKPILKDILRSGYGSKLLELGDNGDGWKLKVQSFTAELVQTHGYQQNIVIYLFDCLAYGLGWINTISQLPQELSNVNSSEYDKNGVHTNKESSEPYFIRQHQFGKKEIDYNSELQKAKEQYVKALEEGIVVPEKTSGYFPALTINQLDFLQEKIKMLSDVLHEDNTQWCLDKKQEVLDKYHKNTSGLKSKAIAKIAVPAIAVLLGAGYGSAYLASSSDRTQYQENISKGDKYFQAGSYLPAIACYKDAYTNYDAFNEGSYKSKAYQKITDATNKLIAEIDNNPEKLLDAQKALTSEQTLDLDDTEKALVNDKLGKVNAKITSTLDNGKNSLVLNISSNGGKLNNEGKKMLKQLLKLAPNDYWLNFIKNKEL